jgi:hypothetical protein
MFVSALADRMRKQLYSASTRGLNWHSFRTQPDWSPPKSPSPVPRVAAVVVNHNTPMQIAMMLWSLRRVADSARVGRIVVVDNNSSRESLLMLRELADRGMIDLICNRVQRFHGPGLNQGVRHLAQLQAAGRIEIDQILLVDSDIVFLRGDAITAPSDALGRSDSALLGEYHNGTLLVEGGYAHPSTLWMNPVLAVNRTLPPFIDSGHPGTLMQKRMRTRGLGIENFPLRSDYFVLHAEGATLAHLQASGDRWSSHGDYISKRPTVRPRFHGVEEGEARYAAARREFERCVPVLTGKALASAISDTSDLKALPSC